MRKEKDWDWTLGTPSGARGLYSFDQAQLSVLLDIRDELKRLNAVLHCPNFLNIPLKLDRIGRNTAKRRKPKVAAKPKLRVVR